MTYPDPVRPSETNVVEKFLFAMIAVCVILIVVRNVWPEWLGIR